MDKRVKVRTRDDGMMGYRVYGKLTDAQKKIVWKSNRDVCVSMRIWIIGREFTIPMVGWY